MDTYINNVADYIFAQSWQIALLAGIIGLISIALKNRSAHIRYLLWLIVLAKCLIPSLYSIPLAILPETLPATNLAEPELSHKPDNNLVVINTGKSLVVDETMSAEGVVEVQQKKNTVLNVKEIIVFIWLSGLFLFILWIGSRAVRYSLWLRGQRKPLPPIEHQSFQELFSCFRLKRLPRIWLTKDIAQPFVWGLFRGSVYLPVDFLDIDSQGYNRTVLAHELCHVVRFDACINVFQVAAQAIYWFHPFVWWVNRKIRQEREKCCDEMAVFQLNTQPEQYTGAIIETLAAERRSSRRIPSLAIVGSIKDIEERIKTIMKPEKKFYKRPSFKIAVVLILLAVSIVPISCTLTHRSKTKTATEPNQKRYESLYEAAKVGSLSEVKRFIAEGADVNSDATRQETPLHAAAANGNKEIIELLIANGAEVDANKPGYTPLTWAIWQLDYTSKKDVVEVLVNNGADVNYKPINDDPAIFYSVWNEDVELAELLLAHGARLDAKSENGWTVLRHAAAYGNQKLVEFFVSKGADAPKFHLAAFMGDLSRVRNFIENGMEVDTKDEFGWTPLFWAASNAQQDIVEYLINKGADIKIRVDGNRTLLHQAARSGELDLAKLLISKGLDNNVKDGPGMTPLHHAARNGHKDVAELLIKKGADVNVGNKNGATPLQLACQIGYKEIIELLVDNGADINSKNNWGGTALHRAAGQCQKDVVEILIEKGADVNARNRGGQSPLHFAAQEGRKNIVELLISEGADANVRNYAGATPLDLAEQRGHTEVVKLLKKLGAQESSSTNTEINQALPLHQAAAADGDIELVTELLAQGTNINIADKIGMTALHYAVKNNHVDVVKLLIARGADVNIQDAEGNASLHFRKKPWLTDITMLLLKANANVNIRNKEGLTPLHIAAAMCPMQRIYEERGFIIIREMLNRGADIDAKDKQGVPSAHAALRVGRLTAADLLINEGAAVSTVHLAAYVGDLRRVTDSLQKEPDVERQDRNGFTLLHAAAAGGHRNVVEYLLDKGANVFAHSSGFDIAYWRTDGYWTACHYAIAGNHPEILQLLLEAGAENEVKLSSLMFHSCQRGHIRSVDFLITHGADINDAGSTALADSVYGGREMFEFIFSKGPDVDATDAGGWTALHAAVDEQQEYAVRRLLTEGADVNVIDKNGWTPLKCAASWAGPRMAEILLAYNADPNVRDEQARTPLHAAILNRQVEVLKLLLDKGAEVNIEDAHGKTPIQYAKENGYSEIVELLIRHGAKE